ncbi:hypothetical protein [Burkholderia sp. AU38729]|uniref:hypothetical protein n=1 Tax=Burkholderia sp. AU38729 TaxID=2879633 RepID=UPI001CF58BF5|nr:hypothetical protein [Burkholderia sp. AU38729]MCA8063466.1 hypothetical protein [Burkholderia sp. AU38729]
MQVNAGTPFDASPASRRCERRSKRPSTGLNDGALHAHDVRRSATVNFGYSCRTKKLTVRNNRMIGTHFDDESLILIAHESR